MKILPKTSITRTLQRFATLRPPAWLAILSNKTSFLTKRLKVINKRLFGTRKRTRNAYFIVFLCIFSIFQISKFLHFPFISKLLADVSPRYFREKSKSAQFERWSGNFFFVVADGIFDVQKMAGKSRF